jgi:uncharacterized protein (DUF4213/DUF364 family)
MERSNESVGSAILDETIAAIERILGRDLGTIAVERVVVGLFFTGVKLDNGVAGACATPLATLAHTVCCPHSALAMPFPGKLKGRPAGELTHEARSAQGIRRAVGIAAINALAESCWRRRPHPEMALIAGVDAFDAAEIGDGDKVVVVGAFAPYLKELKRRRQPFVVLEQDPATLKPDELPFFRPAGEAAQIVPEADVVLITGSTLVNATLEDLLALARPEARVAIVGPTVGMLPDAFFARGVDVLGSIRIKEPDAFLDLLAEGGSGYHFFGRSAEKVVLVRAAAGAAARAA